MHTRCNLYKKGAKLRYSEQGSKAANQKCRGGRDCFSFSFDNRRSSISLDPVFAFVSVIFSKAPLSCQP